MRVLTIVYIHVSSAIDGNLSRVYQASRPVTASKGFKPAASLNCMILLLLFRPHYSGSFLILFILVNRSETLNWISEINMWVEGWSTKISASDSKLNLQATSIACVIAAHKYTTC